MNRSNQLAEADSDKALYQQAYATALRLLARREHSELEIRHKLRSRQCPAAVARQVIGDLVEEGALNERRFSEVYAYGRYERGFGPQRIRAELRERGVDDSLVAAALQPLATLWWESVARQRCKRFGNAPPVDYSERARQTRFLEQRGFTHEQIRAAFDETGGCCP